MIDLYLKSADAMLADRGLWVGLRSYNAFAKEWLAKSGHYLGAPPPGCLLCVTLQPFVRGLFGPTPGGQIVGMCLLGRPIARNLPQDGKVGEITRFALDAVLEKTKVASLLLRASVERFAFNGLPDAVISYHDRSRHSGCIYRKAGFKKNGTTRPGTRRGSWGSRPGREQAVSSEEGSKRRWRIDLPAVRAAVLARSPGAPTTPGSLLSQT